VAARSFDRFVERKWNTAFVWVHIPEARSPCRRITTRGSTVRSLAPPDYQAACAVLVEAAAADMMAFPEASSDAPYQRVD
jgi:hypothetical protein